MTDEHPGGARRPYARPLLWSARMTDNPASELSARVPHPTYRRTILARLTPEGDKLAERATRALADIGYGLGDVSATTASQVTAALRRVRQAVGDLG